MRRVAGPVVAALLLVASAAPAVAQQGYPSKIVHIIVPYVAGGLIDSVARVVAARMTETMGQPVIVENRPGASSILGMQMCAKAAPDGYTACLGLPDPVAYSPSLFKNLPYDPDKDFAPVINLAYTNNLLVAHIDAPYNTYPEMIAYAK